MKNKYLWFLPIPIIIGGGIATYKILKDKKSLKFWSKKSNILPVEDMAFDADSKKINVVKTHITKSINKYTSECNWFIIGKISEPIKIKNDFDAEKMYLLAKSTNLDLIENLETSYAEKFSDSAEVLDKDFIKNNNDKSLKYLYLIVG